MALGDTKQHARRLTRERSQTLHNRTMWEDKVQLTEVIMAVVRDKR